ncbi:gamma-aminobutyric acid receptor subunit alpha-2-like isoform X2 [Convolutriloba macropyga]|uniref:gamma-aminobutyric acid receptor subunit alpha-2-like isoform X2 n=1 Tax=Convolutriloba macropyga TaxID=536237 RepID=UPI003F5200FF
MAARKVKRNIISLILFLTQLLNFSKNPGGSLFAESLSIGDINGETTRASLENDLPEFGYNLSADDESMFARWAVKSLPHENNKPVSVNVMLYLESLRDVSSDVTLDFYMIENWRDPRYVGMPQYEPKWRSPYNTVKLPGITSEKFWYPDSYFYLVKSVVFDRNAQFMEISNDGSVFFNRKVRIVIPCKPNVRMFPFDVTTCRLMMSSYAFTTKELLYEWNLSGIFQDEDAHDYIEEAGFTLLNIPVNNETLNYSTGQSYSAITGDFKLKRKYLVYIVETFVPSALITALSWITFWISRTATPARASVGITTVLTMLTLGSGASNRYDKHISGSIRFLRAELRAECRVRAIDIYVWVCFSFVILSLLEFALADYWHQKEQAANNKAAARKVSASTISSYRAAAAVGGGGPFTRYLSRNIDDHGSGIVHHNCSNCDPPEKEMATLLTNNNSIQTTYQNDTANFKPSPNVANHRPAQYHQETATINNVDYFTNRQWSSRRNRSPSIKSAKIDLMARWIFPTSFFIFNVLYWVVIYWHLHTEPDN